MTLLLDILDWIFIFVLGLPVLYLFVFAAAFRSGFHLLVFIALLNTVISLYYYLLVVKAMYITPNESPIAAFRSDRYTRISLFFCLAGVLLLGVASAVYDSINALSSGL